MEWITRCGVGYDIHRLVPGRRLILGGVELAHTQGLAGHSDADVVAHAVGDALLGALGLGDLGQHFPPGDPRFLDVSSLELLRQVARLVAGARGEIVNVDVSVIAEAPRLAPHQAAMAEQIAAALGVAVARVSIKAKTHEGIGALGRGEAIAAHAVASVRQPI